MTKALLQALCGAGLCVATLAAPTAHAKVIRPQRIPAAKLGKSPSPASLPKTIAASSKVDGIVAARGPRFMRRGGGSPMRVILPSKEAAKAFNRDGDRPTGDNPVCFTALHGESTVQGQPFPTQQDSMPTVWAENAKRGRVSLVRRERFVPGAGRTATLLVTDAYVDAVSGGVKLIGESRVSLARVATGPKDLAVYAAKDGQWVHFVVATPPPDPATERIFGGGLSGLELVDTAQSGHSSCRFLHTSLRADGPGGGQAATVRTRMTIDVDTEESALDLDTEAPSDTPQARIKRMLGPAQDTRVRHEITMRVAAVRLSVSKTKADRQPVVSVGFGWEGPSERINR